MVRTLVCEEECKELKRERETQFAVISYSNLF